MNELMDIGQVQDLVELFRDTVKDRTIGQVLAGDRIALRTATALMIQRLSDYIIRDGLDVKEGITAAIIFGMFVAELGGSQVLEPKPNLQ